MFTILTLTALTALTAADLFLCRIYCTVQKRFSKHKNIENPEAAPKDSLLKKISRILMLSSLLRLTLFIVSYIPSHTIRNFLYRHIFLVKLAENSVIYYGAEIRAPWNLEIGGGSIIGDKAVLDARNGIIIGRNVNFSTGVWIWTEQHSVNDEFFACEGAPVTVEDRAWVSCRAVILPGVTIKEGSVIAAGGVITKDTEPFMIYGGVPGRKIGERIKNLSYDLNGQRCHFL